MVDFNSVLNDALQLSADEREQLVAALRMPQEDQTEEPLSDAWKAEIDRRLARMDSGNVMMVPWEEVRDNARRNAGLSDAG